MAKKNLVNLIDREKMNLLGLMMARIIERSAESAKGAGAISSSKGRLGVIAGKMTVTLEFDGGTVSVLKGLEEPLKAVVVGSLSGLLDVAIDHRPIRSFLKGKVSMKGNPFFALKMLPLFYVTLDEDLRT